MSATITVESNAAEDPYTAFWAGLSDDDLDGIVGLFSGSEWSESGDPADLNRATSFVHIEYSFQPARLYVAKSSAAIDAAADAIEARLRRGPDSLH